jgi:hypothetical protein
MSASTIVVALNAQLLRRIDLRPNEGWVYGDGGLGIPAGGLQRPRYCGRETPGSWVNS